MRVNMVLMLVTTVKMVLLVRTYRVPFMLVMSVNVFRCFVCLLLRVLLTAVKYGYAACYDC